MNAASTTQSSPCAACGKPGLPGAEFCTYCGHARSKVPASRGLRRFTPGLRGSAADLYYVVAAAILAVLVSHLPVIDTMIYPFKLFGTLVHEWSHALVAVGTGGQVDRLQINGDLSGETLTAGGWLPLIFSAGYTGAAIVGALLLLIPTSVANRTLVAIGAVAILMPLIGGVLWGTSFTGTTWLWTTVFAAATLAVGIFAGRRLAGLFQQFVAVELCFTAIDSLRQLAWLSQNSPSTTTDATLADHYVGMPALVWTILWTVVAFVAISLAAYRVVRRSLR